MLDQATPGDSDPNKQPSLFRYFPLEVKIGKGAVIIGNPFLSSLLIAHFSDSFGNLMIVPATCPNDVYTVHHRMTMHDFALDFVDNTDYVRSELRNFTVPDASTRRGPFSFLDRLRRHPTPVNVGMSFLNLPELGDKTFAEFEYAKAPNILQSKFVKFSYLYDQPMVKKSRSLTSISTAEQDGVDCPPDDSPRWNIGLSISDSKITYGPWGDRRRLEILRFFFPSTYKTESPYMSKERVHRALKVDFAFSDATCWRLPFRESSKDYKVEPTAEAFANRSYGWLNMDFESGTALMELPLICGPTGSTTKFLGQLNQGYLSSSVNFANFASFSTIEIDIALQYPLFWRGKQEVTTNFVLNEFRVYLLREHVTLLIDLTKDFVSMRQAPLVASDSMPLSMLKPEGIFYPVEYFIDIKLVDYEISVYVNEFNVIDQPQDVGDNSLLSVDGDEAYFWVAMPFTKADASFFKARYEFEFVNAKGYVRPPSSTTTGEFLAPLDHQAVLIGGIVLNGSYTWYETLDSNVRDVFELHIRARHIRGQMFGFLLRAILFLKDNYFGAFERFMTVDEYRSVAFHEDQLAEHLADNEAAEKYRWERSNPFEFYLTFLCDDANVLLPAGLFVAGRGIALNVQTLQVELRYVDEYQDMQLDTTPIILECTEDCSSRKDLRSQICIESLCLRGLRLFGPRPLAICYTSRWQISIGTAVGDVSPVFVATLVDALRSFVFHAADEDNAILDPDSSLAGQVKSLDLAHTTFAVVGDSVRLLLSYGKCLSEIYLQSLRVDFDSLITPLRHTEVAIRLPVVQFRGLISRGDRVLGDQSLPYVECAVLQASANIAVLDRLPGSDRDLADQEAFMSANDSISGRCAYVTAYRARSSSGTTSSHIVFPFARRDFGAKPIAHKPLRDILESQSRSRDCSLRTFTKPRYLFLARVRASTYFLLDFSKWIE